MIENEFRYFKVNADESKALLREFKQISNSRSALILELCASVNASGCRSNREGDVIGFGWPVDHDFNDPNIITERDGEYVTARGNGRTKSGKAFNKMIADRISEANAKLKPLPPFRDFMLSKLGWKDRHFFIGDYLVTTSFGVTQEVIYCRVPKLAFETKRTGEHVIVSDGNAYQLPNFLTEITYGQFYDASNVPGDGQ